MAEDERTIKRYSLEHGVSTRAWKSSLQLKEWFCPLDLNFEKDETNDMQTHLHV